ncbi:hypothetical protein [Sporosarcina aquimarina]|uniref:HEAT repeat domain-containing protein n=1 Tax=Sporosarcina aquimarina TaxID=114975 RepID=A0ABU4G041_9BACL|nr:hypothetical protein [Sporosarcina aquimarina]MDW0109673.1 hypothetical protein [Sporosarcina aquimarina]
MSFSIEEYVKQLHDVDKTLQYDAFVAIQREIEKPVDWAYEVWDQFTGWLTSNDAHDRARGAQFLAGLSKSDPENRILNDFSSLCAIAEDEKFVTARHALQSIWKVGLGGEEQKNRVVDYLVSRFREAPNGVHPTLVRSDIIVGLRNLADSTRDESIEGIGAELIETEADPKYKKKLIASWKKKKV